MRQLVVTACFCVLTCSTSIASDQKLFNDRYNGETNAGPVAAAADDVSIRVKTPGISLDPQPLAQTPAELTTGMPGFSVLAEEPIAIPQQSGVDDFLRPRFLPPPKPVVHRTREEVCDTLAQAVQSNNLPAPFFIRLLFQESGFRPGIVSHAGAQGIAQFMPETAARVGLDNPFDPLQAIPASARLLRNLLDKFGNLGLAAAAYNAGPKRIHDWLASKGKLPSETQGYVKTITGRPAESWKAPKSHITATKLPPEAPCKEVVIASADPDSIPMPPASPLRQAVLDEKSAARPKTRLAARKTPAAARKSAVKTAAKLPSTKTAERKTPVKAAENKTPVKVAEHKQPVPAAEPKHAVKTAAQKTPEKTAARAGQKSPLKTAERATPLKTAESKSPVKAAEQKAPIKTAERKSTVNLAARKHHRPEPRLASALAAPH